MRAVCFLGRKDIGLRYYKSIKCVIAQIYDNMVFKLSALKDDSILVGISQLVVEEALEDPLCFFKD